MIFYTLLVGLVVVFAVGMELLCLEPGRD